VKQWSITPDTLASAVRNEKLLCTDLRAHQSTDINCTPNNYLYQM